MTRWQKWCALSWADRRLLLRAAGLLAWARVRVPSMRFRPAPDLDALQGDAFGCAADREQSRAQAVARLVRMAEAGVPCGLACLHRSVVLWSLLRREGIACQLRLGAADPGSGPFKAHAWVEYRGVALNERPDDLAPYRPFGAAVVPSYAGGGSAGWSRATR